MKIKLNCISAFSEPRDKFSTEKNKPNEDSLVPLLKRNNGYLMAIADGLGSYEGAQKASSFVCDYLLNTMQISHGYLESAFTDGLKNNFYKFIQNQSSEFTKASTTLSFCFLDDVGLSIWHVGDCRIYIKLGTKLVQITNDHTQYQKLLDKKIYSKKELQEQKVSQNTLTNAISSIIDLEPDYIFIPLDSLIMEFGHDISIFIMSDGAHHFWEQRKTFSKMTMSDTIKFSNALKRRIENKGPIDDYTLIGASFKII